MEEGSVLTSNVPDVRIEDFQSFVAPDVRESEFQIYRTEVLRKTGKMREWTESLVSTVVFVLIFTSFIAQATQVPTPSMVPTIMVGDHFFLDKIAFPGNFPEVMRDWLPQRQIHRGDIIAFRPPPAANMTTPFVKRVIAVPGDAVEIKNRQYCSIANGIEKLVNVPGRGQWTGFSLAVADHGCDDQIRIVERRAASVR